MTTFIFDTYTYDPKTGVASFDYKSVNPDMTYTEIIQLNPSDQYDPHVFERALKLAFLVIGVSYVKSFPTPNVDMQGIPISDWQASFLSLVYQEGLSQFAFENTLTRDQLPHFMTHAETEEAVSYGGRGVVSLQSGGKDSLLVARFLQDAHEEYSSLYITSGDSHPGVLDRLAGTLQVIHRAVDIEQLRSSWSSGGLNGHVPVTYIVMTIGLLQMILDNKHTLVAAIGHEGEEPHAYIGDLAVTHQWSKTWHAEQLFAEYVRRYISPDIRVGSILRQYSELKIAKLFAEKCWDEFGRQFSSCNRANYAQGTNNSELQWCGDCPKCANSYLLFSPFVAAPELQKLFDGRDLYRQPSLIQTFKGLLGIDDVMKPFECIGEVDELRRAYHISIQSGFTALPFAVPDSVFDLDATYETQAWAGDIINVSKRGGI